MSQSIVPNWNLKCQRQEQLEAADERNISSYVNNNNNHLFPMSNYEEVAELTWKNGQLVMHGLGGLLPPSTTTTTQTKPTWSRSNNDTLESIVHQATCHKKESFINLLHHDNNNKTQAKMSDIVASCHSGGKWSDSWGRVPTVPGSLKKRSRVESDQCGRNFSGGNIQEERGDRNACASASATFFRDNDTTTMTWASYESPRSLKTKFTDEDSACHYGSENQEEDGHEHRIETSRSHSSRRTRAAAIHNLSERRRRDRINQKMKALQKLVPNANKTDKASMLDEVIDYLKQLQAQIQLMRNMNMPQMMMPPPLGMQQQQYLQQMSLLSLAAATMSRNATQSLTPFIMPCMNNMIPKPELKPNNVRTNVASLPIPNLPPDPYNAALLAQSMNMEFYNKMAAIYQQQQVNLSKQAISNTPSESSHMYANAKEGSQN